MTSSPFSSNCEITPRRTLPTGGSRIHSSRREFPVPNTSMAGKALKSILPPAPVMCVEDLVAFTCPLSPFDSRRESCAACSPLSPLSKRQSRRN